MNTAEAAYVGALADGEGSLVLRKGGTGSLVITNNDPELISALLRATGVGTVISYYPSGGGRAPKKDGYALHFKWALSKTPDLRSVLAQTTPFSVKAQRLWQHIEPTYQAWLARREAWRQFCKDCGKELGTQNARSKRIRRCNSCAGRERYASKRRALYEKEPAYSLDVLTKAEAEALLGVED